MGLTPSDVDGMSLFQFAACVDGWLKAHGSNTEPPAPSFDEHLDMVRRLAH